MVRPPYEGWEIATVNKGGTPEQGEAIEVFITRTLYFHTTSKRPVICIFRKGPWLDVETI